MDAEVSISAATPNCRGIRPDQGWFAHLAGRHLLSGHLAEWLNREQVVVGASEVRGGNQGQPAHVALHGEWVGRWGGVAKRCAMRCVGWRGSIISPCSVLSGMVHGGA